jgi:hypothetical protein
MPTFGDTTSGAGSFPGSADRALLSPATAASGGTVDAIWVYVVLAIAGGNRMKGVMHADSAGAPGALVAASNASSVITATGWNRIAVAGSPAFVAGNYWIGMVGDDGNLDYGEDSSGAGAVMANGTYSFASPPASWPGTDASYANVLVNCYVEYSTGGGGGGADDDPITSCFPVGYYE